MNRSTITLLFIAVIVWGGIALQPRRSWKPIEGWNYVNASNVYNLDLPTVRPNDGSTGISNPYDVPPVYLSEECNSFAVMPSEYKRHALRLPNPCVYCHCYQTMIDIGSCIGIDGVEHTRADWLRDHYDINARGAN